MGMKICRFQPAQCPGIHRWTRGSPLGPSVLSVFWPSFYGVGWSASAVVGAHVSKRCTYDTSGFIVSQPSSPSPSLRCWTFPPLPLMLKAAAAAAAAAASVSALGTHVSKLCTYGTSDCIVMNLATSEPSSQPPSLGRPPPLRWGWSSPPHSISD